MSNRKEKSLQVLSSGSVKRPYLPKSRALTLPDPPVPKLGRPVLVVPGGNSRSWGLPAVLHYLCHGDHNTYGGALRVDQLDKLEETYEAHGGDVFSLQFTREFGGIETNSVEIGEAVEALKRITGAESVDVVAECKGCIETRRYLQDGGDGIRNFVQMVPPNRGMPVGGDLSSIASKLIVGLGLGVERLTFFPVCEDTLDTFEDMRTDIRLGPFHWNPRLAEMNTREGFLKEEKAVHSTTILMGKKMPLAEHTVKIAGLRIPMAVPGRQHWGDASVPQWSAALPHAYHFELDGFLSHHGRFPHHPEALEKMAETLVTDGNPRRDDDHYVGSPPEASWAAMRTGLDLTATIGRFSTGIMAASGAAFGPLGLTLAGVALLDSTVEMLEHVNYGTAGEQSALRTCVGLASQGLQIAGLVSCLNGVGWPGVALLGAGYLGALFT